MTLILSDSEMGAGIASKLLGQLAERASVCAMVIDRTGRVVAINRGGLERLSATRDEVISQPWSTLWDGSHREAARAALERALSGEAVTEALPRAERRGRVGGVCEGAVGAIVAAAREERVAEEAA